MLKRPNIELICLVLMLLAALRARACGPNFPNNLLDRGDDAVLQAPVADFERELARMKLVTPREQAVPLAEGQKFSEQSTELEMSDLAAALKREKVAPALATVILQSHLAERMKLNAFLARQDAWNNFASAYIDTNGASQFLPNPNPSPVFPDVAVTPGLPREFADYFAGAIAWHTNGIWDAEQWWEQVLSLPASERHFKSTWAAYMIAEACERADTNHPNDDEALKSFAQVRELAKSGFADSAGLATASVGGEAQIWLRRKDFTQAIQLYLEQYAAGDDSAVESLRFTAARALEETNSTPAQLKALALDRLSRQVITAYLVSRDSYNAPRDPGIEPPAKAYFDHTDAWLAAVEAANIKDVELASSLALTAYQAGRMDMAQRWVNRAGSEPVAQWLQAKLFLRAGGIPAAAKILGKLSRNFPRQRDLVGPGDGLAQSLQVVGNESTPIKRQILGELGALRLSRREYIESLDALLRSGYWLDAAYVAEDVLTTAELKNYVDRNWPAAKSGETISPAPDSLGGEVSKPGENIRWLLARRLARETMAGEARDYYPTNLQTDFSTCRDMVARGRNESLPPAERAKCLFAAAMMTRTNGMELFGSEGSPDWHVDDGNFDLPSYVDSRTNNNPRVLAPDPDELDRASRPVVTPNERFHYRFQAADLAFEAAKLMPDNSDETARVLCTAGSWIKYRNPAKADGFYKALVRRCRKTAIGGQADAMRWFPELDSAGNPVPYVPRFQPRNFQPQFSSLHMIDLTNGWAQNARNAILRTTNGGESWKVVLCGSTNIYLNASFYDADSACAVSDNDEEGTNVTILRTQDGGHFWSHLELKQAHPLFSARFSIADTNTVSLMLIPDHGMNTSPGELYQTKDGGQNWQLINSTAGCPYEGDSVAPDVFAAPHPFLTCGGEVGWRDATNGWLLGSLTTTTPGFLFQTGDGGQTWQLQTLSAPDSSAGGRLEPESLPQFFPNGGTDGVLSATYAMTNDTDSDFYRVICNTRDGGLAWQPTTPVKFGGAWNFISATEGWVWSQEPALRAQRTDSVKGTLLHTDDGGVTWAPVPTATGLAAYLTQRDHLVQLDFVERDHGWALVQEGNDLPTRVLRTTDGGRKWREMAMRLDR